MREAAECEGRESEKERGTGEERRRIGRNFKFPFYFICA
jgi:hypothetical protein